MASAINNGTFTFNPEELKDLSEVIHELTFNDPNLTDLHDVVEGIMYDKQIVFAGRIGLMGKAVTGCTPNEISGITLTEKKWSPVNEDFRLKHCSADVNTQDKLVQQMARMNPDFYDVIEGSQSSIGNFLVAKVIEGFTEELLRKIWFNDTAADTIANGGVLTNGTDKGYFDSFDGLFKQIFANITAGSTYHVDIPDNAEATYEAQKLDAGDGQAILKAMYKKADSRLLGLPGVQFYVTRSIWDAYLDDLESTQNSGAGNTSITENGQVTLFYRGIPLRKVELWDRVINSYYNNGTVWNIPHRAVLTVKENVPVGTLAQSDFGSIDAFYDKVTKQNYIDGVYSIDAKHLENYLTVAAY